MLIVANGIERVGHRRQQAEAQTSRIFLTFVGLSDVVGVAINVDFGSPFLLYGEWI